MLRPLVALALVTSVTTLACKGEPFEAPGLSEGRLLGLSSDDRGTHFAWIPDTGTGQRLAWAPMPNETELTWPHGGSAATASHWSYHATSGRLLFSGLLPLGESDEHLFCRPFELTLPSADRPKGKVEIIEGGKVGPNEPRRCAYRWYGEELLHSRGEGHWTRTPEGEERELAFGKRDDVWRLAVHPDSQLVLETRRDHTLRVLGAQGQTLDTLELAEDSVVCWAHDAKSFAAWDAQRGARLFSFDGSKASEAATLPLHDTPEGKPERWAQCAFSPDGRWVAFSSNRQLGMRTNPMAGVKNPIRTLHAWEPSSGQVVLVMPGELEVGPFIWLPATKTP